MGGVFPEDSGQRSDPHHLNLATSYEVVRTNVIILRYNGFQHNAMIRYNGLKHHAMREPILFFIHELSNACDDYIVCLR